MHPAIKIVSLIILSICSTQGEWTTLLLTGVLILPFYIVYPDLWQPALRMLIRLKWLFFSILLIYLILTPDSLSEYNTEQFSLYSHVDSLIVQLLPGLFRVSVLIIIVLAVNLFLKTTSKEQILAALLWLFFPLKKLHIDVDRISLRGVLTLEYIEILTSRLAQYKQNNVKQEALSPDSVNFMQGLIEQFRHKKNTFFHLIEHSVKILLEILDEAEKTSGKIVSVDCLEAPVPIQFMIPVSLYLLFLLTL